jgi:hypothetical protein
MVAHGREDSMRGFDESKNLLWNPTNEQLENPPLARIPHAHYAAIGRVIDAWGDLEFEVNRVIWELMGVQQPFGACVTAQIISIHPKLRALRALLHLWGAADLAREVGSFAGDMYELADLRNRVVHDKRFVLHPNRDILRFEVTTPKELTFAAEVETRNDLNSIAERIYAKIKLFNIIRDKIREMRAASPDISHRQFPHVIEMRDRKTDQTSDAQPPLIPPRSSPG